jgi:hypothetical protein
MQIEDLIGKYQIIGTNQDDTGNTYKGILYLSLRDDNSINAKWIINNTQEQFGTGFFKDNLLTIHFYYEGENDIIYKGKVNYKCLTKNILEGTWTEELGASEFIGTENCFRVLTTNEIVN